MLSHQSEPFLKLTAQFVAESCEGNRLREQVRDLKDELRKIALLPKDKADNASEMARLALVAYYDKLLGE